jgi:hypothetical protein
VSSLVVLLFLRTSKYRTLRENLSLIRGYVVMCIWRQTRTSIGLLGESGLSYWILVVSFVSVV